MNRTCPALVVKSNDLGYSAVKAPKKASVTLFKYISGELLNCVGQRSSLKRRGSSNVREDGQGFLHPRRGWIAR